MARRSRSSGFTLVEVVVALAIAGLVALLAQRVLSAVSDQTRRAAESARGMDQQRNGERWLVEALGSIEVGLPGDVPFDGTAAILRCTTFLRVAGGWSEATNLELSLAKDRLVARTGRESLILATGVSQIAFDYLLEPGLQSVWASAWKSPVSAPLAIRIRIERSETTDTLLFLVGARG